MNKNRAPDCISKDNNNYISISYSYTYMNLTLAQLNYLIAIADTGSLTVAAERSHISQPAISMQLKNMEEIIGLPLVDRQQQPLQLTAAGQLVVSNGRLVQGVLSQLEDALLPFRDQWEGELKIGIIPTLAPYLLPLFIGAFTKAHPKLSVKIMELKTQEIIDAIEKHTLDAGILITPLKEPYIREDALFYERFVAYINVTDKSLLKKPYVAPEDLLAFKLWMLEEGNCFRTQTINLCGMAQTDHRIGSFEYTSGNIETLIRMVDKEGGVTLLPELAILDFTSAQQKKLKFIGDKKGVYREVSLVYSSFHHKKNLLQGLKQSIQSHIPKEMLPGKNKSKTILPLY